MPLQNMCQRNTISGKGYAGYWIVILCFSLTFALFSQSYPVRTYSMEDGLASATINGITQDHDGLMWYATTRGISSYDGQTFHNYGYQEGIPFDEYFAIKVDKNNVIWACTNELKDGLVFFNRQTQRWSRIQGPVPLEYPSISITSMALLDTSRPNELQIGFATRGQGFYLYSTRGWVRTSPPTDNSSPHPISVFGVDSHDHKFYLVTNTGLYLLDPKSPYRWTDIPINSPTPGIRALAIPKYPSTVPSASLSPQIWLCGEDWAGYYYQNQFFLQYHNSFPYFPHQGQNRDLILLPDQFGGLWVANKYFLCNINPTGDIKNIRTYSSLITDGAYSLFYDREFNLWVGNFRGANKITNFCFENYNQKDGLYDNEVTAMVEYRPGFFAFGHNGGFSFLGDNKITTLELPDPSKKFSQNLRVLDMCLDHNGNIWAAINKKGILKITPLHSLTAYALSQTPPIDKTIPAIQIQTQWYTRFNGKNVNSQISSIVCHPQGQIYAFYNNAMFKWNRQSDQFLPIKTTGAPIERSRRLFIEKDGTGYLATFNHGLLRISLKKSEITRFISKTNKNANSVYAVHTTKQGIVLVGTQAGLFFLKEGYLDRCMGSLPQIDDPVYFILDDLRGYLWFGLSNGLSRWDGQHARHYKMSDGLVGREANRAASLVDSSGRVWIGMDMGASCYYHYRELPSRPPPLTQWLYLDASGTRYSLDHDNVLEPNQNDLSFYFRGISFVREPSITYLLRLEGYDKQWSSQFQSFSSHIRYPNLAAGKYRFHMQALNVDGVASAILSSGTITIKRPFSQSILFYLLLLTALSTFILALNYAFSRKRRAAQLEKQVKLRTRQLVESEEELRNIFNNAHDAILIFDPQTEVILDANQRACDIYGFLKLEFIGMSLKEISIDLQFGEKQIANTIAQGTYQSFESTQFRKDGLKMFLEINASVIMYRGKKAILSINRDVTPRKLASTRIKESLREKECLLKEIHHRVKNNLQIISSLLDLHAETLEDDKINRVFMDSKNRIYSMALLHENLYQSKDLARINIKDYIHDIFDHFLSIYGDVVLRVTTTIDIASITLSMDEALPLGLILTELVSNTLKYAFPEQRVGTIHIHLIQSDGNQLLLTFSDDGIGLPKDLDINTCNSLGIQLITILTRQLKGHLEVDRTHGTKFQITIPYTPDIKINQEGAINDKNKNNDC